MNGFILILKNYACFIFTGGLGGLFNLIGKLTVCTANMGIAYVIIYNQVTELVGTPNSHKYESISPANNRARPG